MLKVAIVGCGKIADSHASQIIRIRGSDIVAACDREELMAKQLYERFPVRGYFSDLTAMLEEVRPDVVHVTTPPQTHFAIAKQCLESGCHVYVEKPFTLYTDEAETLISFAQEKNLKITVGHDDQFRQAARRMRALIQKGYLGGPAVHMESYYCYDIGQSEYAKALLGDKDHWVRKLPGGLLHNVISHGIARIAEFMPNDNPDVIAFGFVSPTLRRRGETEIIDELRVIVSAEERVTAYFTFSSEMRPSLHQFRIFGPKNGLMLDQDNETVIKMAGRRHKSYLEQFVPPVAFAKQYAGNWMGNARRFLANDFHPKAGMKHLIESFYGAVRNEGPLPIPYAEILRTSRIMDSIFGQLNQGRQNGGLPIQAADVAAR